MGKFSFERDILPVVSELAARVFARHPNREELVADAVSVAWEGSETAPDHATAGTIGWYAVRHVRGRGQFARTRRSIDSPHRTDGIVREAFDPNDLTGRRDDPADLAAFRLDYEAWQATLNEWQRRVANMLAAGTRTGDAAKSLGVSRARVSQMRRELATSWEVFRS